MKQNYIDGKGNYHNEQNLTLAQIYDSGVEFGCKVTAKGIIEELEKIKAEIKELAFLFDDLSPDKELVVDLDNIEEVIDKHISELKGEKE